MCADGRAGTGGARTGGSHLSSACVVAHGPQVPARVSPPSWSVCPAEACFSVSWGFLCSEQAGILGTNRDFALARPQLQAPLGQASCPLPWDFHPQENPSLPGMGGASPELDRMATSTTLPSPPLETVKTSICRQRSTNISLTGGDSQPLGEA